MKWCCLFMSTVTIEVGVCMPRSTMPLKQNVSHHNGILVGMEWMNTKSDSL